MPDPSADVPIHEWGWKFVRALWRWATTDDIESLWEILYRAPSIPSEVAATVLIACALLRHERHEEALGLLTSILEKDQVGPVDQAWLLVQRGRVRTEIGDVTEARADAIEAQRQLVGDANDVTVSALAAAAAWQLFMTATIGERKLDEVLTTSDTAVSWWRSQTIAWGLQEASMRAFRVWAQERAHRWSREDRGSLDLFAAELNADVSGEQGAWKAICLGKGYSRSGASKELAGREAAAAKGSEGSDRAANSTLDVRKWLGKANRASGPNGTALKPDG